MDGLSPIQRCLYEIYQKIEMGLSCRQAMKTSITQINEPVRTEIMEILFQIESGGVIKLRNNIPDLRKAVYETLILGVQGQPILDHLEKLKVLARRSAEKDIDVFVAKTPVYCLLIVLLFFFPGFLILILGPILEQMIQAFGV